MLRAIILSVIMELSREDEEGLHGPAWDSMGQHGTAWDSMGQHGTG